MLNGDPSLPLAPTLSTEMVQKYLEENKELIVAIMEGQSQGKFTEVSQCLAKLQHNLTYLAKLADDSPQSQTTPSQGQGMLQQQQHPPHVAISQRQADHLTLNSTFDMNEQQQHLAMSRQQYDISASRMPFQMNEQQHKLPGFFQQQQQLIPGPMVNFGGTNSDMYQAAQTRLSNMSDMPESNQIGIGSDVTSLWSLGKSPSGPTSANKRS